MKSIQSITLMSLLIGMSVSFTGTTLNADSDDMSVREVEALLFERMDGVTGSEIHRLTKRLFGLCEQYDFPVSSVLAVIQEESRFDKDAVSSVGARGLMQIMPNTAKFIAERALISSYRKASDLHDPFVNLSVGVAYLSYLRGKFGQSHRYLSAYNMGPAKYSRWSRRGSARPPSVARYVKHIHSGVYDIRREAQDLVYAR